MGVSPFVAVVDGPKSADEARITILECVRRWPKLASQLVLDDGFDLYVMHATPNRKASEAALGELKQLFDTLCRETDWHLRLDWDDLDELFPEEYISLDRPSGISEPTVF